MHDQWGRSLVSGVQMVLMGTFGGGPVSFGTFSADAVAVPPAAAIATGTMRSDGRLANQAGGSVVWHSRAVAGVGSTFWTRATLLSGTAPTGAALATWLPLSANQAWSLAQTTVGSKLCSLRIEVATSSAGAGAAILGTLNISAEGVI